MFLQIAELLIWCSKVAGSTVFNMWLTNILISTLRCLCMCVVCSEQGVTCMSILFVTLGHGWS